jgi:hypothetical protein
VARKSPCQRKMDTVRRGPPRGTHWEVLIEDVDAMANGEIDVSGIWKDWRKEQDA